jgi:hypothetical protein
VITVPEALTQLAIEPRRVVHETIDGEVILIQLETGYYYSLDGTGAEIWELLRQESGPAEIVTLLCERHGSGAAVTEALVTDLLRELCEESLLVGQPPPARTVPPGSPNGLAAPVLRKYTDMEDFLLVDPVHEVDSTGWPNRKADG